MIEINSIVKSYKHNSKITEVLKGINWVIMENEIVSLIGRSGCGKSTLAQIIVGLEKYNLGTISFNGTRLNEISSRERNIILRREVQYIFQNSKGSLNPMKNVFEIFDESVTSLKKLIKDKTYDISFQDVLDMVGLDDEFLTKRVTEMSGGQQQRIAIARALLAKPNYLILDEPVSNLDTIIQAKILNLLIRLHKENNLAMVFITHDTDVAYYLSEKIYKINDGVITE